MRKKSTLLTEKKKKCLFWALHWGIFLVVQLLISHSNISFFFFFFFYIGSGLEDTFIDPNIQNQSIFYTIALNAIHYETPVNQLSSLYNGCTISVLILDYTLMTCLLVKYVNLFIPEFLKWVLPSLNSVRTTVPNRGLNKKSKQTDKKSRSWWDSSLWAISSGPTLSAK